MQMSNHGKGNWPDSLIHFGQKVNNINSVFTRTRKFFQKLLQDMCTPPNLKFTDNSVNRHSLHILTDP